jgi:hypothetical protein
MKSMLFASNVPNLERNSMEVFSQIKFKNIKYFLSNGGFISNPKVMIIAFKNPKDYIFPKRWMVLSTIVTNRHKEGVCKLTKYSLAWNRVLHANKG